jgi:AbrB family looped-hinge helix DNA binding protein
MNVTVKHFHTKINAQGRINVPAKMRQALKLKAGTNIILRVEGNSMRVTSLDQAIENAQNIVAKYFGDVDLVGELIAQRRLEASAESSDDSSEKKS